MTSSDVSGVVVMFSRPSAVPMAVLFDEGEGIDIKRARSTCKRPGGSNAHGREDYNIT